MPSKEFRQGSLCVGRTSAFLTVLEQHDKSLERSIFIWSTYFRCYVYVMYGRMYSQPGHWNQVQKLAIVKSGDTVVAEWSKEKEVNFFVPSSQSLGMSIRAVVIEAGLHHHCNYYILNTQTTKGLYIYISPKRLFLNKKGPLQITIAGSSERQRLSNYHSWIYSMKNGCWHYYKSCIVPRANKK